jgi:hypothetical protein
MHEIFERFKGIFIEKCNGIILLFLLGTIYFILEFLFPIFINESIYNDLVFGVIFIIVGGFWGSRAVIGRTFGNTICFLGLLITVAQIYVLWGWLSLVGSLPLAFICLNYVFKACHKKRWVNAPEMFRQAKKHHRNNEKKLMWDCLAGTFIDPYYLKNHTTEVYKHNAMVLAFVVENLSGTLQDEQLEKINLLISYYKTIYGTSKDVPDDMNDLAIFVAKLITSMGGVQQEVEPDSSPSVDGSKESVDDPILTCSNCEFTFEVSELEEFDSLCPNCSSLLQNS